MAEEVGKNFELAVAVFFFLVGCRFVNDTPNNQATLQPTKPDSPPEFGKTLDAIPTWTNFSTPSPDKIVLAGSPTETSTQTISPTPTESPTWTISNTPTRTGTPTRTRTLIPTQE